MVKKAKNYINDTRRIKIPIRLILFWRKKIKSYINSHILKIIKNKEYPTIYISKEYPKMSILELYERINNHLNKYFPIIYQKLNSNTKNGLMNIKKDPQGEIDISPPKKETKKNKLALIQESKKDKYSKEIMSSNKKSQQKIKQHLNNDKLSNGKYNQCYRNNIVIEIKHENNNENKNVNELDTNSNSNSIKDLSPSKSSTTSSSSIFKKNKYHFLTHYENAERKSKYFNNDSYYINKLKLIQNKNLKK